MIMNTAALISSLILIGGVLYIVWGLRIRNGIGYKSTLVILISAVFAGLVIIGCPLSVIQYREAYPSAGRLWIWFAAVVQSVQNALRTFVLDGSWSELLPDEEGDINIPIFATVVGLTLNVIAPILTFSAILSLFKEITSKIRVKAMVSGRRPLFLFSELNKNTLFLAEDIRKKYPKANLVYTDVYPEDDEVNYELRDHAGRLHAVLLRTDISQLEIRGRHGITKYFLFGHDEEENVTQAKKLFFKNRDSKNVEIYVMAVRKGNELIIDSLTASLDIKENLNKAARNNWDYEQLKDEIRSGGLLKIRRVYPEKQIAWREIPEIKCVKDAIAGKEADQDRILSILIFADTRLSLVLIKTLLWYCQSDKFRLEINIVYSDNLSSQDAILSGEGRETVNVRSLLEFECPDIIRTNKMKADGEAFYDIEFIGSSDFESGSFQTKLIDTAKGGNTDKPLISRMMRTDGVIVDRGTDGATLETAAFLRTAFERVGIRPEIYAVCADEEEMLKDINDQHNIVTYKDNNYDIQFIGKINDAFSFDNLCNDDQENLGFCQHIKWIDVSYSNSHSEDRENNLKRELLNYERHEYFRNSSIVKAMYLRNVLADPEKELTSAEVDELLRKRGESKGETDENTRFEWRLKLRPEYECQNNPEQPRDRWSCKCEKCMLRRELEHRRWNAYMRTEGYIPSPGNDINDKRSLAKVHGNLVPFSELSQEDREKDG